MKRILGVDAFRCRKFRGLIAASIYNDLSQNERMALDTHLQFCPACRKQAAALGRVADLIPVASTPALDQDLWPDIRRALRRSPRARYVPLRLSWGTGVAVGLCVLALGAAGYGVFRTHALDVTGVIAGEGVPLENDLAAVAAMVAEHDYVSAYRRLEKAIVANPGSPLALDAQVQLADLAYSKLNWYPEAFEAYDRLLREYGGSCHHMECLSRHELLDEARALDYAPLYALDAARRAGDDSFCRLEAVIARYPETLVASVAAEDMARQSLDSSTVGGEQHVTAMERAKGRCTNPVAIARLKLEIGHIYMRELKDTAKARSFYAEVANFEDRSLATLAEGSLAALETPQP